MQSFDNWLSLFAYIACMFFERKSRTKWL